MTAPTGHTPTGKEREGVSSSGRPEAPWSSKFGIVVPELPQPNIPIATPDWEHMPEPGSDPLGRVMQKLQGFVAGLTAGTDVSLTVVKPKEGVKARAGLTADLSIPLLPLARASQE